MFQLEKMMKLWSVVENGKPLQCLERETPVPEGQEILLEVTHCGVCHSDLHFQHGSFDLGRGQVLRITDRGVKLPCAPGHEIVGRVVAMGPDATGATIGDHRIIYPWMGCGTCEMCRSDRENMCYQSRSLGIIRDGGFGSHVVVPNDSYLFDFGALDPALASTLACSGLTVYSAIRKAMPLNPDKPVLIVGAGGLGMVAIALLKALGQRRILVADISAEKREAALAAGAESVFDNSADDAIATIIAAAGGPLQAAIDLVNMGPTIHVALETLEKGGRLVVVGVGGGDYLLSLAGLVFRPRSIIGTVTGSRQELREVVALAQSGKFTPPPVTRMPKDSANEALNLLEHGKVIGRLVLSEDCCG